MRRHLHGGLLLGLAVLAFYVWSAHFWIDVVDEGYFLDLADRVRLGALPYRDFTTYYTPGVFFLFAWIMKVFGVSVLPIRYVTAGLRAAAAVLMFGLTRRVASWPWALVPVAILLALDHWPIEPEPHPSWPATVAGLATLELIARHHETPKTRWLACAGAMAGVSFLFKQNVGAFTALGIASYVVLRPRACGGRVLRAGQALFGVALAAAVTVFLWPGIDGRMAVALWAPTVLVIATTSVGALARRQSVENERLASFACEALAAAAGFGLMTAVWLMPLAVALGPANVPLGLFVGSIDSSGLIIGFDEPSLDRLHLYIPALAAWAGLAALVATRAMGNGVATWYLLFGTFALLGMYPRSDSAHALVSSPLILVAGAWALAQVRRRALAVALLGVPLLAVAPQLAWRIELLGADTYQPLGLERADVLVPRPTAEDTRGVVEYVQGNTPAGFPVFVYPAAPLLNFLAERPAPSRFDHFFPGTLSAADFATIIGELEKTRPRYVIWDHRGVVVWGTDPANRPLSDYLWSCYGEVAAFHLYLVLERRADTC